MFLNHSTQIAASYHFIYIVFCSLFVKRGGYAGMGSMLSVSVQVNYGGIVLYTCYWFGKFFFDPNNLLNTILQLLSALTVCVYIRCHFCHYS